MQCLFEPRVIEFDQKRAGMRFLMRAPDMAEEMVEQSADKLSERYVRDTPHCPSYPEAEVSSGDRISILTDLCLSLCR